jgi:hypothetical protein
MKRSIGVVFARPFVGVFTPPSSPVIDVEAKIRRELDSAGRYDLAVHHSGPKMRFADAPQIAAG